jgi:uncharacterized protein (TIGR04222 family)
MLTLPGPEFLLLYAFTAVLAYALVSWFIARREEDSSWLDEKLRDPYAIAYLRGGIHELLKVVTLTLKLRGELEIGGSRLLATRSPDELQTAVPIERAVLLACARSPKTPAAIAGSVEVRASVRVYRRDLRERGLLAGWTTFRARLVPILLAMIGLVAFTAAKISVALQTGHRNIGLLLLLTIVAVFALFVKAISRRTQAGKQALAELTGLFMNLNRRAGPLPSGAVAEAALLAAIYGNYALAGEDLRTWKNLWSSSTSSSCGGASCGGGGGDGGGGGGGGGSCGGGGDGGGGGCGGCGH